MSPDLALRAEDACLNGWPSLTSLVSDGWLLRFAEGHTKRANSINVIGPRRRQDIGLDLRIRAAEEAYAARGLPTVFRLSSLWPDVALERALDDAGYGPRFDASLVLAAPRLASAARAPDPEVVIDIGQPSEAWLSTFGRISDFDARSLALHARILAALATPAVFARLVREGEGVATAFGAVHDGLVCLNSVATAEVWRGRGFAGRAVAAILAWAEAEAPAEAACLPVGAHNAPALALYRRLGFTAEVSRYHYRVAARP